MKLFLLTVGIMALISQVFTCNFDTPVPNYAALSSPKKTFNVPKAYGICVAPNGNFAVVSSKIYIYYSCGKLMKSVDPGVQGSTGCAFTDRNLYVVDFHGKKVYELSTTGKFIRIFATGYKFFRIEACRNRVFVTTDVNNLLLIYDTNGRKIRQVAVPNRARWVIVGIDNQLYVVSGPTKALRTYTLDGKLLEKVTKREIVSFADGLAMDSAGNILITGHNNGQVFVYSPCGKLIKTIKAGKWAPDVKIGKDGTILVTDHGNSKVYMY